MVDRVGNLGGIFDGAAAGLGRVFQGNPFGSSSPFSSSNPFGAGSPFGNQQPFGGSQPFSGNPFGQGISPFGAQQPFGQGNPFGSNNPFGFVDYRNVGGTDTLGDVGDAGDGGGAVAGEGFGSPDLTKVQKQLGARGASPLQPLAGFITQKANEYGVPIAIVLAHAGMESGYGTDQNQLTQGNNFFGLTGTGTAGSVTIVGSDGKVRTFAKYNTAQEGIDAAIRNMGSQGYRGLTLRQYLARYLTGDPNGTTDGAGGYTDNYLNVALSIIKNLGGNANANSVVVRNGGSVSGQASGPIANTAAKLIGTPYVLGGLRQHPNNPEQGLDCSEFTAWAWKQYGVTLPWNAQQQYNQTTRVTQQQLKPGDLVFFHGTNPADPDYITHVGIYIGNGRMINSQTGGVMQANLSDAYWSSHLAGYGRVAGSDHR